MSPQSQIGDIGEMLVALFEGCVRSTNPFDEVKDMTDPFGKFVEVKTQNRYAKLDVMTTGKKTVNLRKCMQVDRLIFVEYGHGPKIKIWEVRDRNNYFDYATTKGIFMRGWRCSGLKLLHELDMPKTAAQLRALSTSFEFKKK
jgi:hypothetical protein